MNLKFLGREGGGRDSWGVRDGRGHTAVFNIEHQQGVAVSTGTLLHGSLEGRGAWGRTDAYSCSAESLFCSLETHTTLFANQLYPTTKLNV